MASSSNSEPGLKTTAQEKLGNFFSSTMEIMTTAQEKLVNMKNFIKSKMESVTTAQKVTSLKVHQIRADRIQLSWKLKTGLAKNEHIEVYLKKISNTSRWTLISAINTDVQSSTVADLIPDTQYVFKVKVVNENGEGDFSSESKMIKTNVSAAIKMREQSKVIESDQIQKYRIPVKQVKEARNEKWKTRRFEIGERPFNNNGEKTILLVGATGTGKSTLIDGLVNYIFSVNFNDDFRLTLIRLENSELVNQGNQAESQTDWITCYTIYPSESCRITCTLNIIDTPGFGDTRGFERDGELIGQIRHLFSEAPPKGVIVIDAVCFLVKAPDARLTAGQKYIFQQIMSLFGKDIENNICTLITFADGEEPPVLHAIRISELPFGQDFRFNNSALFASNKCDRSTSFSTMFWSLGMKSFEQFFEFLETLKPRSLEMTKNVLHLRNNLETAKRNLKPLNEQGLGKMNEIKQEIEIFEKNQSVIRENENFKYTVTAPKTVHKDLPPNKHTTNCRNCNLTCHDNCAFEDDKDKAKCIAMGRDGKCTHCPGKCIWSRHTNSPYILVTEMVTEERSYAEMKKKYKDAAGKTPSLQNVLKNKRKEFEENTKAVQELLNIIYICNNKLEEITLRPSPLSSTEYIDTWIKSEEMEKEDGYAERVQSLKEIRRRCDIDSKAKQFTLSAEMTITTLDKTTGMKIRETVVAKLNGFRDLFDFHIFKK